MSTVDSINHVNNPFSLLNNMLNNSPETLITQEFLKIISSLTCIATEKKSQGIFEILKYVFKSALTNVSKIAILMLFHHVIMKNPHRIIDVMQTFGKVLFYKKIRLFMGKVSTSLCMARRLKRNQKNGQQTMNGLPIYGEDDGSDFVVEYLPIIHSNYLNEIENMSNDDFNEYSKSKKTILQSLTGIVIEPKILYPSKNYVKLTKLVGNFFKVMNTTKAFKTLGILIDGKPGLGKTDSLSYITLQNICKNAIHIDMTKHINESFKSIINKLYAKEISGSYVIFIDELDKHLDYRITSMYESHRNDYFKKIKQIESENQDELSPRNSPKVPRIKSSNQKTVLLKSFEEFVASEKEQFFYELLNLIETDHFKDGVVFIFCANNFNTVFNGAKLKHFDSLYRRLLKVNFVECDSVEFKGYVKFTNDNLINTDLHIPNENLEKILKNVKQDLQIPFRDVCHTYIESCFNIEDFVNNVNNWVDKSVYDFVSNDDNSSPLYIKPNSPQAQSSNSNSSSISIKPHELELTVLKTNVVSDNECKTNNSPQTVPCNVDYESNIVCESHEKLEQDLVDANDMLNSLKPTNEIISGFYFNKNIKINDVLFCEESPLSIIKNMLNLNENTRGRDGKADVTYFLFKYIIENLNHPVLHDHIKAQFGSTIMNKARELLMENFDILDKKCEWDRQLRDVIHRITTIRDQ